MAELVTAGPSRPERVREDPQKQPAHDAYAPDAPPDSVADLLRRLPDAAAAHDQD